MSLHFLHKNDQPKPVSDHVHALALGENLPGMRSQLRGLITRAGWEPCFRSIKPGILTRLAFKAAPHWLRRKCLCSSDGEELDCCKPFKEANVIVSIGGKGANFGRELRSHDRPVVQVQNPRQLLSNFDLVVACHHDNIAADNVLAGRTALHDLSPQVLRNARLEWEPKLACYPRPLTVALIGGSNGRFRFGKRQACQIASCLATTKRAVGGSLIVISSRRTDRKPLAVLKAAVEQCGGEVLTPDCCTRDDYIGLIACADDILVTVDSVSMISEAVATTAPVSIFPLPGRSRRISRFVEDLELSGRIQVIEDNERLPDPRPVLPLDDTDDIIDEMHYRLGF